MCVTLKTNLKENYSPLYYLGSLGAGGLSISVYMYLMFMIEHPKTPMATFEYIFPKLTEGSFVSLLVAFAFVGILYFAYVHFRLLVWNIKEYGIFKRTKAYEELKKSNAEVTLMAIPLTYAMTINVCFVLGATFVPSLWEVVEFMFPLAIMGFLGVGAYGLRLYGDYIARLLTKGDFDFSKNNNFSQMLPVFTFSMVSVGLAAPGAMSHYVGVSAVGLFFSILFMSLAIILLIKTLLLGFKSMYEHGLNTEGAGTLWIMIPVATLLGIAMIRISFGLVHNFSQEPSGSFLFMFSSFIVGLQIIVGLFGYTFMRKMNYFDTYVKDSSKKSAATLGLICPGVAFFVFGMFFIFFGLLNNGVVEKFSFPYFLVLLPFVLIQLKTMQVFFKLYKKLLT